MSRPRKKDTQRVVEALNSPVNPTGVGEASVVQDLLSGQLATASNREGLQMELALEQLIRGQNSLLELVKQNTAEGERAREEVRRLNERMDKMDEAERKFAENQEKFMQDVLDKAMSLRRSGEDLDKMKANAAAETQRLMTEARINAKLDAQKFEAELQQMPKVKVVSPGVLQIISQNGRPTSKLYPEVVKIKHMTWVLHPGKIYEVPKIVGDVLENRRASQQETSELETALSSDLEAGQLAQKMNEIKGRTESKYDPSKAPSPI